jgi:tetratricopeptide (TPR) repeat protein
VSAGCRDPRFREWIHAYELGLLGETESELLEAHMMDCANCFSEVQRFRKTTGLINNDADVHALLDRIVSEENALKTHEATELPPKERSFLSRVLPVSIAAAAALIFLIVQPWEIIIRSSQEAVAAENRVAVMHFANLTDTSDSLATGAVLASLLTTDLSRSSYVQVVSQRRIGALYRFLNAEDPGPLPDSLLPEIARHTAARYVLTGDIRQDDSSTLVTVALHDVEEDLRVAAIEVAGGPDETYFSLVDRLTVLIKAALGLPEEALNELDPCVADITTDSPDAYYHYIKAKHAISRMYAFDAARQYRRALDYDHTFAMAWYGLWQLQGGDYIDSALVYADSVTEIERRFIAIGKSTAEGDIEGATNELREVLDLWPDEPQALLGLANFEMQAGRYDSAVHYLNRSIEVDPLFKMAYNQLAYAYLFLGDYTKAIAAVDRYIAIAPDEPNPHDTKGDLYAAQGSTQEAIRSYAEALRVNPDFNPSAWKLGHLLLFDEQFDSAYSVYKATTQSSIPDVRAFSRQFMVYPLVIRGQYGEALVLLDDGIGADRLEDQPVAAANKHLIRAYILAELSRPADAIAEGQEGLRLLEEQGSTPGVTYETLYALLLTQMDSSARAEQVAARLLQNAQGGSRDSSYYFLLKGAIARSEGRMSSATAYLERAVNLSNQFEARYWLARHLLESRQPDRAAGILEELLQEYTGRRAMLGLCSVRIHYYLGIAYEQTGRKDRAREQYERFLRIRSDADFESEPMSDARARLTKLNSES